MPWHWAAMAYNVDYEDFLIRSYLERGKKVFQGDLHKIFQRIVDHSGESQLDSACDSYFSALERLDQVHKLEPGLLACAAAYGYSWGLASILRGISDEKLMVTVMEKVNESRLLEWAVLQVKDTESGKDRLFALKPLMDVLNTKYMGNIKDSRVTLAFRQQLRSCFATTFTSGDQYKREFAIGLAECCPLEFSDMIKAVVKGKVGFEEAKMFEKRKDKGVIKDENMLVEDIPLAYWVARLRVEIKKMEPESESGEVWIKIQEYRNLVEEAEKLGLKLIGEGYLDEKGRHTGRTALHWAAIFQDTETVISLCAEKKCNLDIVDNFGKPAFWYAESWLRGYALNSLKGTGYLESLHKEREQYVDALNAILVGAALIASVTFGGFMSPPLNYSYTYGKREVKYGATNIAGIKAFWAFNSMSFFFAMASALAGVTGVLPSPDEFNFHVVQRLRWTLLGAATLLVASIVCFLLAFGAAGLSDVPPLFRFQSTIVITAIIGGPVCVGLLYWFLKTTCMLLPYRLVEGVKNALSFYRGEKEHVKFSSPEPEPLARVEAQPPYKRTGSHPWEDGLDSVNEKADAMSNDVIIQMDKHSAGCSLEMHDKPVRIMESTTDKRDSVLEVKYKETSRSSTKTQGRAKEIEIGTLMGSVEEAQAQEAGPSKGASSSGVLG